MPLVNLAYISNTWEVYMIGKYILTLTDAVMSIVEFLLSLRIVLKLLNANDASPFVRWIYETTRPLLAPFEGMFPSSTIAGGFTLEASALFALLIYAFVGFLIQSAIMRLTPYSHIHEKIVEVDDDEPVRVVRKKRR